jgi:hypothetical protein
MRRSLKIKRQLFNSFFFLFSMSIKILERISTNIRIKPQPPPSRILHSRLFCWNNCKFLGSLLSNPMFFMYLLDRMYPSFEKEYTFTWILALRCQLEGILRVVCICSSCSYTERVHILFLLCALCYVPSIFVTQRTQYVPLSPPLFPF